MRAEPNPLAYLKHILIEGWLQVIFFAHAQSGAPVGTKHQTAAPESGLPYSCRGSFRSAGGLSVSD